MKEQQPHSAHHERNGVTNVIVEVDEEKAVFNVSDFQVRQHEVVDNWCSV